MHSKILSTQVFDVPTTDLYARRTDSRLQFQLKDLAKAPNKTKNMHTTTTGGVKSFERNGKHASGKEKVAGETSELLLWPEPFSRRSPQRGATS
jgi:hypothetical protein